jgi:hypothetical protein
MRFAKSSLLFLSALSLASCAAFERKPEVRFVPDLYTVACEHGCVWLNDYGMRVPLDDEILLDNYYLLPKSDLLKMMGRQ